MELLHHEQRFDGLRVYPNEKLANRIGNECHHQQQHQAVGSATAVGLHAVDQQIGNKRASDCEGHGDELIEDLAYRESYQIEEGDYAPLVFVVADELVDLAR